jgi:LAO/AO transport system kinase
VAVLAVDPSSPYSGGAVLGDRIRMIKHVGDDGVYIRSFASRGEVGGLSAAIPAAIRALVAADYDWIVVETVGVGQSEVDVAAFVDTTIVVSAPGLGDSVQADKAGVLEIADVMVVNKADRADAKETVRDLTASLRLAATPARGWRVPVVATQADVGGGIGELLGALDAHRAYLTRSAELEARRCRGRLAEWEARARQLARARVDALLRDEARRARVGTGAESPEAAAMDVISAMNRPGEPRS